MDATDSLAAYETASPRQLADQPVDEPYRPIDIDADWQDEFQHLEGRFGALINIRWSWWVLWCDLAGYILPRRYRHFVTPNSWNRGAYLNTAILDSTGTQAMEICASGMTEGLTPESREWLALSAAVPGFQPDRAALIWFEDTKRKFYQVAAQSNFYTTMGQGAQDLVTFGTAPTVVYEDYEDVARLYLPCPGEYVLGVGPTQRVEDFGREYSQTVAQIVEFFKLENCPRGIQESWKAGGAQLEKEYVVRHLIEPNFPIARKGRGGSVQSVPDVFTYREFYWLRGEMGEKPMSRRGFHECPFAAARWSIVSNDAYGRGPGMDALGDIKELQQLTRRALEFIEKLIRPPMGADPELKNEPASTRPAEVTYMAVPTTAGRKGFWALYEMNPAALEPLARLVAQVQQRIQRAFLNDIFSSLLRKEGIQPLNELELAQRNAEIMRRLGPVIGLWKREYAANVIQRMLAIMQRRKLLAPLPPSLRGIPMKLEIMDMVTLAQLGAKTASMEQMTKMGASLTEASQVLGIPSPMRTLDLDKFYKSYGEAILLPPDLFLADEEVAKMDEAKAAQQRAAQVAQLTQAATEAARNLGNADVGGGQTALGAMFGARPVGTPAPQ